MVPSIARQSVIIKCNQQTSVLLGNYEFYYLSGLLNKLYNLELTSETQPLEMIRLIQDKLDSIEPKDEKEAHLLKMVSVFKPSENYDEQMKELFEWGATEEKMWQVQI